MSAGPTSPTGQYLTSDIESDGDKKHGITHVVLKPHVLFSVHPAYQQSHGAVLLSWLVSEPVWCMRQYHLESGLSYFVVLVNPMRDTIQSFANRGEIQVPQFCKQRVRRRGQEVFLRLLICDGRYGRRWLRSAWIRRAWCGGWAQEAHRKFDLS